MKAPKFPLYIVTLFFVSGMLISPWVELNWHIGVFIIMPFLMALSKKYRVFIYLVFLPLGVIHHQQFFSISKIHFSQFMKEEKEKSLLIKVSQILKPNEFQSRYYGEIIQVDQQKSKGKILINIEKNTLKKILRSGDFIFTQKKPKPVLSRTHPGGFDYKKYLNRIKIYNQLSLKDQDFVIVKNQNLSFLDHLKNWNTDLEKKLDESSLGQASKRSIKAILLGKRNAMDRELIQAYADAGVIHILAISGLHMGVIMLFLGFILKPLKSIPAGNWIYIICIILLLWGFALFAGAGPSVIRAVTMFTGLAIARYAKRIHSTLHLLIVSLFLLLVLYPPFLYQIGFQMSYLAVLGIIKIDPVLQRLWQPQYLIIQKIWKITTVCLAAQMAVAPLSIYYFHQFPGLFMLTNWMILPFFGLFLIGSLGLLILIVLNIEFQPLIVGYDYIVTKMNETILWIAHQEGFLFKNMRLSLLGLIIIYAFLVFLYWCIRFRKIKFFTGLLSIVLLFQIVLFFERWDQSKQHHLWLFYQHNKTVIGHQSSYKMTLYSPQDISRGESFINDFKNKYPIDTLEIRSFKNTYISGALHLLVIDEKKVYEIAKFKASHVLLTNDPKVNLDRVLLYHYPKMVFADGSNKPWNVSRWKQSCQKLNIPLVNLRENGAVKISL